MLDMGCNDLLCLSGRWKGAGGRHIGMCAITGLRRVDFSDLPCESFGRYGTDKNALCGCAVRENDIMAIKQDVIVV
ncbi:MAG: hypothetical protein ACJAUW_002046 [Yoonia sp.]|jgi:hypothetical protein